jgi:hypothetical protein
VLSHKKMWAISLTIFFLSCTTTATVALQKPKPASPKTLQLKWIDLGEHVALSKADAIKLMHWLLDVELFLE